LIKSDTHGVFSALALLVIINHMLLKLIKVRLLSLAASAVAAWALVFQVHAQQDNPLHASIKQAIQSGQIEQARRLVQEAKERDPKDIQLRFLEGVVLAQSGQNDAAIDVFEKLTKDRPELPEPWNNLGALYAAKGKLEEARLAFQKALNTDNSYRVAHRNLSDMQVQMARNTYKKALQLEGTNKDANAKLALIGGVVLNRPALATVNRADQVGLLLPEAAPAKSAAEPVDKPTGSGNQASGTIQDRSRESPPNTGSQSNADQDKRKINRALQAWAKAWSDKDLKNYFAAYASAFEPQNGQSRKDWREERKDRIVGKKSIQVQIYDVESQIKGSKARVTLRQRYESDGLKTNSRKTFDMVLEGDQWLIVRESNR
jgi:tetratricopeptide (TPR) repeat protein